MKQVELKFLEVNVEEIVAKLEALECQRVFEGNLEDAILDSATGTLKTKKMTLRVRNLGNRSQVTLKQKISKVEAKITEDTEFYCDDYERALAFFHALGYVTVRTGIKHRVSYQLLDEHGHMSFELDTPSSIPTWLEIEAPTLGLMEKYVKLLDLDMACAKSWTTADVLAHYKSQTSSPNPTSSSL